MAKALNKNRILASKISIAIAIFIVLLSKPYWAAGTIYHELFELLGITLISICAIGRVYTTAFLGGFKNEILITNGIYSVMRNPLYFFTLIGILGISLLSNHIVIMTFLPLFFGFLYLNLIRREQSFLEEKFGECFLKYKQKVPALIPNFSNYNAPSSIEINPRFITNAFLDAVWWLSALPIIKLAEYLQVKGVLPILFTS